MAQVQCSWPGSTGLRLSSMHAGPGAAMRCPRGMDRRRRQSRQTVSGPGGDAYVCGRVVAPCGLNALCSGATLSTRRMHSHQHVLANLHLRTTPPMRSGQMAHVGRRVCPPQRRLCTFCMHATSESVFHDEFTSTSCIYCVNIEKGL